MAVALWGLLTSGAAYLFVFEPGRSGIFPVCPFRALTGFTCPGCGTTRALHQLFHGNLLAAVELNPLLFLVLPLVAYLLFAYTRSAITGTDMPELIVPRPVVWLCSALVLGFWVFRNTPMYPFPS